MGTVADEAIVQPSAFSHVHAGFLCFIQDLLLVAKHLAGGLSTLLGSLYTILLSFVAQIPGRGKSPLA